MAGEQEMKGTAFDNRPLCRPVCPGVRQTSCFRNGQFGYIRFFIYKAVEYVMYYTYIYDIATHTYLER